MIGMIALNLFKAVELRLNTHVVKVMDATLASRNVLDFRHGLIRAIGVKQSSAWTATPAGCKFYRSTVCTISSRPTHLAFNGGDGGGGGGDGAGIAVLGSWLRIIYGYFQARCETRSRRLSPGDACYWWAASLRPCQIAVPVALSHAG